MVSEPDRRFLSVKVHHKILMTDGIEVEILIERKRRALFDRCTEFIRQFITKGDALSGAGIDIRCCGGDMGSTVPLGDRTDPESCQGNMLDGRTFGILSRRLNGTGEKTVADGAEIGDGDTDITDVRELASVVIRRFVQRLAEDRNGPETRARNRNVSLDRSSNDRYR
jgi:hypothetical protein